MRAYFDENFSPHLVAGMRVLQDGRKSEEIEVYAICEEFGRGAKDELWIPEVARQHGVAITQDLNINRTRAQWELCQRDQIGMFFIQPPKKLGWSYWQIVQLVVRLWPELMKAAWECPRPFGFQIEATRPSLKKL